MRITPGAKRIGDQLGVDWDRISLSEFSYGMMHEFSEHSDVLGTGLKGLVKAGRTAHAHLKEHPHYYTMLAECMGEPGPADDPSLFPHVLFALAAFGALWVWFSPSLRGSK